MFRFRKPAAVLSEYALLVAMLAFFAVGVLTIFWEGFVDWFTTAFNTLFGN
jgi:Flp pilus assembly pilin Flp